MEAFLKGRFHFLHLFDFVLKAAGEEIHREWETMGVDDMQNGKEKLPQTDLSFSEMMALQMELWEKNREKWPPMAKSIFSGWWRR